MKVSPEERFQSLCILENDLREKGINTIAGVDEAGRGPLAGPVVAGAVVFLNLPDTLEIDDSKKISSARRKKVFNYLVSSKDVAIGFGVISEEVIDDTNIREASFEAMRKALFSLPLKPDHVIVDGYSIPQLEIPQRGVIGGDRECLSIAAASIIAKVIRDDMMDRFDKEYPGYGFSQHKGYGTRAHMESLRRLGPCKIHRKSFRPVKIALEQMSEGG
ncbi:MAG: ribonuclease HII [Candidatus Auribacterota bacterium]|nr:ribonuclease HII [Candidatus Auribacterota bacterium]